MNLQKISNYLTIPIFLTSVFSAYFTFKGYQNSHKAVKYINTYPTVNLQEIKYDKKLETIIIKLSLNNNTDLNISIYDIECQCSDYKILHPQKKEIVLSKHNADVIISLNQKFLKNQRYHKKIKLKIKKYNNSTEEIITIPQEINIDYIK